MNNIYRIEDEIFTINSSTHIKFNTKVTKYDDNKTKSFYSEFKTNNRKDASILSRRKLEYYLTFEYSYQGTKASVAIVVDQMYELLDKLNYIQHYWLDYKSNHKVFGMIDDRLVLINQAETVVL